MKIYYNDKFPACIYIVYENEVFISGACGNSVDFFTKKADSYWYSTPWHLTNWKVCSLKKNGFEFIGEL